MKLLTLLIPVFLLLPSAAYAKLTKAECKAHVASVKELTKRLGLSEEVKGRALMTIVGQWIEQQDESMIEQTLGELRTTTAGVRECDSGGFTNVVQAVKGLSVKLEWVVPWIQNAAKAEPCQALINQAVRKRSSDLDAAIADLERSVAECEDENWLAEAHGNLSAMYYERGTVGTNDFEEAREQMRKALTFGGVWAEDQQKTLRAVLARPAIEAGKKLMEQEAFGEAQKHWQAYIDIFGTTSFDILFDVEQVAHGAWPLRDLKDARYQLSLACLEAGDVACATGNVREVAAEYKDDSRPIRELTSRAFELAGGAAAAEREESYSLAFDLLAAWHEIDADSYQIKKLVDETFLPCATEERLELLRMTKQCWIPMHVADALKREGEPFLEEVKVAASCGGPGDEAGQMLAQFHLRAARDQLDRLGLARSAQEKRAVMRDIETEFLPKITDAAAAGEIKARLADERAKLRDQAAMAERDKTRRYSGCTELLATIQWNVARENEYDSELRDFKESCCGFLTGNTYGWTSWMRSKPEGRLEEAEIQKKEALARSFCGSK